MNFGRLSSSWLLFLFLFLWSCGGENTLVPKPRGYPRIDFPEKGYKKFTEDYCNFTFEYPVYAEIIQDTLFFGERPKHPCWFDIYMPAFNSKVHCSYYSIDKENSFEKLREDAFTLAYKHAVKANSIDPIPVKNDKGVGGFTFLLEGPSATSFMFFLTDTSNHFLRGSLYFNTQAKPDSLAPAINFVQEDLFHLLETFEWN